MIEFFWGITNCYPFRMNGSAFFLFLFKIIFLSENIYCIEINLGYHYIKLLLGPKEELGNHKVLHLNNFLGVIFTS